jgi:tRNA(fMet)-specific endonuclease VapC
MAAIQFLLDTNTVSFHIRRSSSPLQRRLRAISAESVALSVVTEMEVRYGLAKNPALKIAPLVEVFLQGISILPLDSNVARHYATVRAELDARGTPIGPLDLMIAAHALSIGATLITTDLSEFRRIPALLCADWTH